MYEYDSSLVVATAAKYKSTSKEPFVQADGCIIIIAE